MNWNTSSRSANERRLQLEAQTLRMSQDMEHQALSVAHQREQKIQRLKDQSEAQLDQWKQQISQMATYKAQIHALHTELQNITEKSALQAALSARMISKDAPRPIVESEQEVC